MSNYNVDATKGDDDEDEEHDSSMRPNTPSSSESEATTCSRKVSNKIVVT